MINLPLFKASFKRARKLIIGFTIIIIAYLLMTASMYDPSGESDPFSALPKGMREALGMELGPQSILSFLSTGFYGVSFLLFMIFFCLIVSNQLIANLVDRGSMAYLLTTPVAKKKVASTQAGVLVLSLLLISTFTTIVGAFGIKALVSGVDLNVSTFIQMNTVAFLLFFVISGYAFFFSSIFNETKWALTASGGLSFVFFILNVFSNSSDNLVWLKYFTLFTAFQPLEIVKGNIDVLVVSMGLGISGILLYVFSIILFSKRDLPL